MYETRWKTERGGNSTEHVRRGAAHSNSEDSIGTGNHARREKQNPKPDLAAEAGTGACEMSSTLNALKETQNT